MSYNLWRVEYLGTRNHVVLLLETENNGDGIAFHVIGTILQGMNYETRPRIKPENEAGYVPDSKRCIGTVKKEDVERLDAVCRSIPPPAKQMRLNGDRIDHSKPLRRCGEWIEEVIEQLREQEILQS